MNDYKDIIEEDIEWVHIKHYTYGGGKGHWMYRDNKLGIQCEHINRKIYFYIDNDEREFTKIDDLITAYNEMKRNHEYYVCVPNGSKVIIIDNNANQAI